MKITCTVRNFTAFGNEPSVIPLDTKGLTLIRGLNKSSKSKSNNGAGKSQILNAIAWGLFGEVPKGVTKAELVNSDNKKNCYVFVDIEHNGKTARIERYIADSKHKDNLYFLINGEDKRGASNKDTQENINTFLGLDYASFITAVLFTMDEESSFAGKTPSNQDKVFTNLLKMDYLVKAKDITTTELKSIRANVSDIQSKISKNEIELSSMEKELDNSKNAKAAWEADKSSRIKNLEERAESLNDEKERVVSKSFDTSSLDEQLKEKQKELDTLINEKYDNQLSLVAEKRIKLEGDIAVSKKDISDIEEKLETAQEINGYAVCPTCESPLDEKATSERVAELNKSLKRKKTNHSKLADSLAEIRQEATTIQSKINARDSIKNEITQLKHKKEMLVREQQANEEKISNIDQRIKQINDDINTIKEEKFKLLDTFSLEVDIDQKARDIDEHKKQLENLLYREELYSFWEEGFSAAGIRNLLVESIIPELNELAAKYSSVLTGGELLITFAAQKELASGDKRNKLEVKVTDLYGSDNYHTSSGGEKRRIDLCVNLTLHMLVAKTVGMPFVFLDEALVKLDRRGIENALQLFRDLTDEIPSIYIVTNQDDISNEDFDNIWTVVRTGRESKLELE